MIKQLRAFWVARENLPDFDALSTLAYSYPARECERLERCTIGFREFPTLAERQVVEVCGSRFLLAEVQRFKRSVPGSVAKRELNKRLKKLVNSGQTITNADKKAIKSDIEAELLPKMPQTETIWPLVIDTQRDIVWVGASSDGAADDVLGLLRNGGLNLNQTPLFYEVDLGRWLTDWMLDRQPLPDGMSLGIKAKISASDVPKVGVSISNETLSDEEIQAVASTRSVMEIELVSDAIQYCLAHDGSLKSIKVEAGGETFEDLIHQASYTLLETANALDAVIQRVGIKSPY